MRLLLDPHALIWWWLDDPTLGNEARAAISDAANDIFVSAATAWEIATKVGKGQLLTLCDRLPTFDEEMIRERFRPMAGSLRHGVHGGALPGVHKDPFDRLIAAQALLEDCTVATRDPEIASFGCKVLW